MTKHSLCFTVLHLTELNFLKVFQVKILNMITQCYPSLSDEVVPGSDSASSCLAFGFSLATSALTLIQKGEGYCGASSEVR